jgi:hypothetical protein
MKARSLRVDGGLLAVLAMSVAACSAPAADPTDPTDPSGGADGTEAVGEESQDLTASRVFHCRAAYAKNGPEVASIKLTKTRATFTASDPNLVGAVAVYTYNPTYAPRAASHQGYAQYANTDSFSHKMVLLFDGTMRAGGAALTGGGHGGDVVLEGPRISHGILSMFCTR